MLCDIGGTVLERRGGGMTENIAIYCLKAASELNTEMCEECPLYGQTGADHCCEDALQVAIKALEELQQYRTIGTVEECRAAVEKQKAKKPRPIDYKKYIGIVKNAEYLRGAYWCLNCNQAIKSGTFCKNCGQKLDWSDEE